MKQTAVEWLFLQMENLITKAEITNMDSNDFVIAKVKLLQEAKEMEKDQQCQKVIDFLTWTNKITLENPMALETDHDDIANMFLNGYYPIKSESDAKSN